MLVRRAKLYLGFKSLRRVLADAGLSGKDDLGILADRNKRRQIDIRHLPRFSTRKIGFDDRLALSFGMVFDAPGGFNRGGVTFSVSADRRSPSVF